MIDPATPIDWDGVKRKLRELGLGLDRLPAGDPARVAATLRARAAALARRGAAPPAPRPTMPVLVCALGRERYGIERAHVVEILRSGSWAPVPGSPPELLGLVHHHGEALALVSLARLLDLGAASDAGEAHVVVMRRDHEPVGLLVDRVTHVEPVAPGELKAPPEGAGGPRPTCIRGLTPDGLILLDVEATLARALGKRPADGRLNGEVHA